MSSPTPDPERPAPSARERSRPHERLLAAVAAVLSRNRFGGFLLDCGRAARAVARGFRGEKIGLRASALTYITIFSLVPFLAVAFAVVRALGQDELRRAAQEFIYANLAPGVREQVGSYLDAFISRASAGALGSVGGVVLLFSAVSLLHNIERSLNEIWGVTRPRTLLQRALVYWAVLTFGPVALGMSLLASGALRRLAEATPWFPAGLLALVPLATTVLLLAFVYLAAPNARVNLRAAAGGALVAGCAWELAKHGYALYAARSFRYSAIYGSLGAIPLFLLWVYASWLILLFGARLAYALQHAVRGPMEPRLFDPRARELLAARVALAAAANYLSGAPPPSAASIAKAVGVEAEQVVESIRALCEAHLLAEVAGGVIPARAPDHLRLVDIARAVRGTLFASSATPPAGEAALRSLADLFAEADRQTAATLSKTTIGSLARTLGDGAAEKKTHAAG
jgi:membrane protein